MKRLAGFGNLENVGLKLNTLLQYTKELYVRFTRWINGLMQVRPNIKRAHRKMSKCLDGVNYTPARSGWLVTALDRSSIETECISTALASSCATFGGLTTARLEMFRAAM